MKVFLGFGIITRVAFSKNDRAISVILEEKIVSYPHITLFYLLQSEFLGLWDILVHMVLLIIFSGSLPTLYFNIMVFGSVLQTKQKYD